MNDSMKVGVLSLMALILCAGAVQARTTFPHVNDNYDISDPAAWGGVIPADEVTFTDITAVYTNSRDLSLRNILQTQSKPQDIVFRMNPAYAITLSGAFSPYYAQTKQTLEGGVWNIGGILTATTRAGSVMLLTNGVMVTATSFRMGADNPTDGKVTITDSSELHFGRGDGFGTIQNTILTVSDGSQMTWNNGYFQPWETGSTNNLFLVTGAGSTANCEDKSTAAKIADGTSLFNTLRVDKGATMWVGGGNFGCAAEAVSNRIEVVGEGSKIEFKGSLTVNKVEGAFANDILVADGGEIALTTTATPEFILNGGGRSTVLVSNATFRASRFTIGGEATSTGNLFRVYGKNSVLATPLSADKFLNIFGKGSQNRFELDSADWTSMLGPVGTSYAYGAEACSNTVAFLNGSSVSLMSFRLGFNAGTGDDNVLLVAGGSTLNLWDAPSSERDVMIVGGARNLVVVSNATISINEESTRFSVGYPVLNGTTVGAGNGLVLQGLSPLVSVPQGTIRLSSASRLVFDLPVEGYSSVPLVASKITLADDTEVDIRFAAFQKPLKKRASLVLARAATALSVGDAVLAAANAKLIPNRCELKVNGNDLVLDVRTAKEKGVVLVLK